MQENQPIIPVPPPLPIYFLPGRDNMVFSVDTALKMIPEFSGNRENLHRFIACCDIVSPLATTRADQALFLNVVKTKLAGPAFNLIKYKTVDSYDELKTILEGQYLEKRTIAQIQTELLGSRQFPNEPIRQFANRVERLTIDLNDACIASEGAAAAGVIQNLNKKSSLKAFVEGLQNPYKLIIKASRYETFHDAVEAAIEEERTNQTQKIFHPNSKFSPHSNSQKQKRCFKCGRNNHTTDRCYANIPSSFPNYPSTNSRIKTEANVNRVQVECGYCHNLGHTLDQCRKRAFNHSRNPNFTNLPPNSNRYNPPNNLNPPNNFNRANNMNFRNYNNHSNPENRNNPRSNLYFNSQPSSSQQTREPSSGNSGLRAASMQAVRGREALH